MPRGEFGKRTTYISQGSAPAWSPPPFEPEPPSPGFGHSHHVQVRLVRVLEVQCPKCAQYRRAQRFTSSDLGPFMIEGECCGETFQWPGFVE